jgi:hypothetical protein
VGIDGVAVAGIAVPPGVALAGAGVALGGDGGDVGVSVGRPVGVLEGVGDGVQGKWW